MGTRVITVRLGSELDHTDFTVNRDLICDSSSLFKNALDDGREEYKELTLEPDIGGHASIFKTYIQWLYSSRLHIDPRQVP